MYLYVSLPTGLEPCADFQFNWVLNYQPIASEKLTQPSATKEQKLICQQTKKDTITWLSVLYIYLYLYFYYIDNKFYTTKNNIKQLCENTGQGKKQFYLLRCMRWKNVKIRLKEFQQNLNGYPLLGADNIDTLRLILSVFKIISSFFFFT